MKAILGISAFYHDSAAALVVDGDIVAAAQEERFTRKKNDEQFPSNAIAYCLEEAGLKAGQLDYVAFYDKPLAKFDRLLETYLAYAPRGYPSFRKAMPVWLGDKLYTRRMVRRGLPDASNATLIFLDHHESHAASAFFPSPYDEAAILTLDGVGEWSTTTIGVGRGNRLELSQHLTFPHSLGLLYSAFTYYCGFKVNHGEYKLMGLAPYGRPRYRELILRELIDLKPDGTFWLDMQYFNYCQGLTMTGPRFDTLFGGPPRHPDDLLEQRHMDLAASIQVVTEEIMLRLGNDLHRRTGMKSLVLAGGVALNCVGNGRLLRESPYESIWIQPAAGDAGGALGAALFVWHQLLEHPRAPHGADAQKGSLLGPRYSRDRVRAFLEEKRACYRQFADEDALLEHTVELLAQEKVVGWFQDRMEFGPRALGARSILGDPRSPHMQAVMNQKIKLRESFRPFAPCVLREHVHDWFAMRPGEDSPYMLLVAPVREEQRVALSPDEGKALQEDPDLLRRVNIVRSTIPAVTHVDYSARVQTVDERHGRFYRLLKKFHEKTGCPVLVNTSFNMSWEPIVLSPEHAHRAFMQSEMDALMLEDCVVHKDEQPLGMQPWVTLDRDERPESPVALESSPWADPTTGHPLVMTVAGAVNPVTGTRYLVEEGIPRLFVPTAPTDDGRDVTEIVKQFYEETPFPNYEDLDNRRALIEKARRSVFARLLNEQIPYDASVVEIGCGTGQLTNFLSIPHRAVIGVDACLNSLRLAQTFKTQQDLAYATFAQMNLFRPGLRDGFFDVVISNGVLHHTSDCRGAFGRIARLAKPGGHVLLGLYSGYSRRVHYARRAVFRWTGIANRWLDPHFGRMTAAGKRAAWFRDQYEHPHETVHTLDEVLRWLDDFGLEFVNSIPKPRLEVAVAENEDLFAPRDVGTSLERVLSQLWDIGSGYREGGFFIVIARRKGGVAG